MRWAWIIVRQLLIGAVITVIVAWACALWSPAAPQMWWGSGTPHFGRPPLNEYEWVIPIGPELFDAKEWPTKPQVVLFRNDLGITRVYMDGSKSTYELTPRFFQAALQSGWPCRALSAEGAGIVSSFMFPIFSSRDGTLTFVNVVRTGLAVPDWLGAEESTFGRSLPRTLLWRGFIANSVLWGSLAWLVHPGIRRLIRSRRYRANRCIHCNHPMLDRDGVCTECGRTTAFGTGVPYAGRRTRNSTTS